MTAFMMVYGAVAVFWDAFTASSVFDGFADALEWVLECNSELVNACIDCGAALQDLITWAVGRLFAVLLGL